MDTWQTMAALDGRSLPLTAVLSITCLRKYAEKISLGLSARFRSVLSERSVDIKDSLGDWEFLKSIVSYR